MSWMSQLYATYEKSIGKTFSSEIILTPIAHMNANAQVEIILNEEGEFRSVVSVGKNDSTTLIPVTESSASRSSGIAPHALCDTLSYIAGDFENYCKVKNKKNGPREKFDSYIGNLGKWVRSAYSHPKVKAIYTYLSQKTVMADLIKAGLVELKEDHTYENKKIEGQPYEKALVRFRVLGAEYEKDGTWEDEALIKDYTEYYLTTQQGVEDVCYFTGRKQTISGNHPKGIVAANYGAKLVSANDTQGFTYRGRFQNAEQSYALSYEASQKIHSALTWLVKNQGAYVGTKDKRMFLCWNPEGKKTPHIFEEFGLIANENEEQALIPYKKKLVKTFQGYQNQFDINDTIIVLGLDAATTGRLSVTYYNEFMASDFFDRIIYWGETCNWFYQKFNEKRQIYYQVETPVFRRIAECAFGREKGSYIELDDRILKEQTQRLLKCMLEKQPLPFDFVQALVVRASTPLAYSKKNRERVLSTACAIISKYYREKESEEKGESEKMKLDCENQDRSYLFGRLLAICEKVERATYDRSETRAPNAIRLQAAYVNHPLQTWKTLDGLLNPYFRKLTPGLSEYYKNLISEVLMLLQDEDEWKLNHELDAKYLLGYYLQRAELNRKKEIQKEEKENE